jgi:hypothetical protein
MRMTVSRVKSSIRLIDIPPFAFKAPGRVLPKKFPPGTSASFHVERAAIQGRKHDHLRLQIAP